MSQPGYSAPVPGRPLGVAIISILLGLYGIFTVLAGILIVVLSNYSVSLGGSSFYGFTGTLLGVVLIVLGLIILGVAVGLWDLRMWALVLAILVLLIEIVGPFISLAEGKSISLLGPIVELLLLIYLVAVRRHFL